MRAFVSCCLTGILLASHAGCAWPGRKKDDVKRVLGVEHESIKVMEAEDLEAEMAQPRGGLRLMARTDKAQYLVGEPIIVDVRIENVTSARDPKGGKDIPVYFEPTVSAGPRREAEWLVRFYIRSERDNEVAYRSPEVKVPKEERANYYHFVTLPPQSFVGRRFVFLPASAGRLLTPGRYTLVASYVVTDEYPYVIINRDLTEAQVKMLGEDVAYARVWTGRLYSNHVEFRIKSKKRWGLF